MSLDTMTISSVRYKLSKDSPFDRRRTITRDEAFDWVARQNRLSNAGLMEEKYETHLHECMDTTTHIFICKGSDINECSWRDSLPKCPITNRMSMPPSLYLVVSDKENGSYDYTPKHRSGKVYNTKTRRIEDEPKELTEIQKYRRKYANIARETELETTKEDEPSGMKFFCVSDGTLLSKTTNGNFRCTNCGTITKFPEIKEKKTPIIQRVRESPKYHRFMFGKKSKESIAENNIEATFGGMMYTVIIGMILTILITGTGKEFNNNIITNIGIGIFSLTWIVFFLIPFFFSFYTMYIGGLKDTIYSILVIITIICISISLYYLGTLAVLLYL